MSQIVEDNFCICSEQEQLDLPQIGTKIRQLFDGLLLLIQKANADGCNFKVKTTSLHLGKFQLIVHLKVESSIFDSVLQILIDLKNKIFQCRTSLLEGEQFLLVRQDQKRKVLCRKLLKINNQIQLQGFKFIHNMQNGKIILLTMFQQSQKIFNSKDLIWCKIKNTIKNISQTCSRYSLEILQLINKEKYKSFILKNGGQLFKKQRKQEISIAKLIKQIQVSHINFGFSSKADQCSYPTFQRTKNQEQKLQQLIMNIYNERFQPNSKILYSSDHNQLFQVPQNEINYQLEHAQSSLYASYLKVPIPREPNLGENKFIFNNIQVINASSIKFKDTQCEGGKNKIFISKIPFYYIQSGHNQLKLELQTKHQQAVYKQFLKCNRRSISKSSNPILTKLLAVKVPKKIPQIMDQKYQNQINIIKLFKSGVTAYILKYYMSKQLDFEFKDYLMMDFIPNSQPLSNFIQIYKETLSLNSKLYILVNLANSLRFIRDYQIVHMDLNLNNVLVYREYLTKLIDFGEAYSPNLSTSSGTVLKRGYTFPFCSPEYFHRKDKFTIQQDVFSFGIIAYRLIFDQYPFFASNKLLELYKNNSYLKRIFLAPERGQAYTHSQTVNLLYNFIFKCISAQQTERCQPSWITIFLKILYLHFL